MKTEFLADVSSFVVICSIFNFNSERIFSRNIRPKSVDIWDVPGSAPYSCIVLYSIPLAVHIHPFATNPTSLNAEAFDIRT